MIQIHDKLPDGRKVMGWACEAGLSTYGVVVDNVLFLTRLTDGFNESKQFDTPDYRKVIKKAKAKHGVRSVVECPQLTVPVIDGQFQEQALHLILGKDVA